METTSEGFETSSVQQQQLQLPPVMEEMRKMKVVIGIDDSDESFYSLKWMLNHFCISHQAKVPKTTDQPNQSVMLNLVHVQEPFHPYIIPGGPIVYATPGVIESARKDQREISAAILSRALQICKGKMIKAETLILEGDPKEKVCEAAEQMHADLLVVGCRGLSKIKRAFLGSVSDYCANHAPCPVLIVKPPK